MSNPQLSNPPAKPTVVYSERQWVPWWWWPVIILPFAIIAAEVHLAKGIAWIPYVLLLPLPVWALLWLSRHTVRVTQRGDAPPEFWVDDAHLEADLVSRAAVVPKSAKSATLGRNFDPAAYMQHRPWIGEMVVLVLDDPEDPTPYWIVSARRPRAVLEALGFGS